MERGLLLRPRVQKILDDPRKIERLKNWCEDATRSTGKIYRHLYVRQEDWDSLGLTPNSFAEIVTVFKDFEEKSKKSSKDRIN